MPSDKYDALVIAVNHKEFINLDLKPIKKNNSIVYDVKNVLKGHSDGKL